MRRTGPPDITIESFINEDLRKKLQELKDQVDGVTGKKVSVSIPEFDSLVSERADRKGVYPSFLFRIPTHTFGLTCYLVKKSEWDTAGTTRKSWVRYSWFDEITDDDRDNGTFQGDWKKPPLDFDTAYYVVFLKAYDILEEVFATNPEKTSALPGNGTPGSGTHLFEWTTRKVFPAVPPAPDAADILSNGPYLDDGINGNAKLEFRLWASADHSAFVEDLDILDGAVWLLPFDHDGSGNKVITADTKAQRYDTEAEYETAIEYDVPTSKHRAIKVIVTLPLGKKFRWYRNMLVNPAGKGKSVLTYADPPTNTIPAGVDFWAGGKVADSDADIPEPTITVIDQIDSKHSEIQINFTQPSTPILLKRLWVEISYDGGTTWKVVYKNGLRDEENFDLSGAHSVKTTIKHKVDFEQIVYKLRATLVGIGRVGADQHSPFKITITPTSFTPTYGPPTAIPGVPASGDATRVINSDTEEPDERVTVTLRSFTDIGGGLPSTTPMSFRDGHVTQAHAVLVNGAGTEKFRIGGSIDDNTATTAVFSGLVPLGETLYWKKTIFANGDGRTVTTAAGSGAVVASSIARATADVDVPVPSFNSITQIDNKHSRVVVRFTQPATPIYLKKVMVEESLDNGVTWSREREVTLKSDEGYHTTGAKDVTLLLKHPAGISSANLLFRAQILAVGGWKSAWVNSTGQTTASDMAPDTAAPGGTLTAPTVIKLKRSGLKLDLTPPTTNKNFLRRANVYLSNTAHTLWLKASDLTTSTATESLGAIQTGPTGGVTIPVSKDTLETIFGAGATIHVYASWTNDVGTSSFSGNTTYVLSGGETSPLVQDTAVPSGLGTPVIDWTPDGRLRIRGMTVSTDIHTLKKKYLVITNGSGTYFDIPSRGSAASEAAARYEFGLGSHIILTDVRKKFFVNVFGTGSIVAYFYAENDIGVSSASSNSNSVTTGSMVEVMSDTRDAIRVVDVQTLMSGPQNLLGNGDCGFSTATSTNLQAWRRWDKTSGISNANTTNVTTTSTDLSWLQSDHAIKWDGNGSALVQKLSGLVPGDYYALTMMIQGLGGVFTVPFPVITVGLIRQTFTTNEIASIPTITCAGIASGYIMLGAVFQLSATADNTVPHWLSLSTTFALGTKYLQIDRLMMVRGKQPYSFIPFPAEIGNGGTPDFDVTPNAIVSPDYGDPTNGTQGGWFTPGNGGVFTL